MTGDTFFHILMRVPQDAREPAVRLVMEEQRQTAVMAVVARAQAAAIRLHERLAAREDRGGERRLQDRRVECADCRSERPRRS